jgi:hypothetical protein
VRRHVERAIDAAYCRPLPAFTLSMLAFFFDAFSPLRFHAISDDADADAAAILIFFHYFRYDAMMLSLLRFCRH